VLNLVSGIISIAGFFIGDYFLTKWLAAIKLYLDRIASDNIRKQVSNEYLSLIHI
jgi:hypothetical protein